MEIKKIIASFIVFSLALFQGCSLNDEYITPDEIAKNQSETIINCVKNKDLDSLKEILCEKLKSKDDIEVEIQELFDFIDGNIISYDEPIGRVRGGKTTPEETILKKAGGHIESIVTDTGRHYLIQFSSCIINKGNEDYIGVYSITILDKDKYDSETGYSEDGAKAFGIELLEPIRE